MIQSVKYSSWQPANICSMNSHAWGNVAQAKAWSWNAGVKFFEDIISNRYSSEQLRLLPAYNTNVLQSITRRPIVP